MIKYCITDKNEKVEAIECCYIQTCAKLGLKCEECNALKAFKSEIEVIDFKPVKLYKKMILQDFF
jgi:hypothetical protein